MSRQKPRDPVNPDIVSKLENISPSPTVNKVDDIRKPDSMVSNILSIIKEPVKTYKHNISMEKNSRLFEKSYIKDSTVSRDITQEKILQNEQDISWLSNKPTKVSPGNNIGLQDFPEYVNYSKNKRNYKELNLLKNFLELRNNTNLQEPDNLVTINDKNLSRISEININTNSIIDTLSSNLEETSSYENYYYERILDFIVKSQELEDIEICTEHDFGNIVTNHKNSVDKYLVENSLYAKLQKILNSPADLAHVEKILLLLNKVNDQNPKVEKIAKVDYENPIEFYAGSYGLGIWHGFLALKL